MTEACARGYTEQTQGLVDIMKKEGIGLQVRDIILSLGAAQKACSASESALAAATENRDLNVRAYQNELVETDDVVQVQLMEAMMAAQHYKARYEHAALRSRLDLVVGTEVLKHIQESSKTQIDVNG